MKKIINIFFLSLLLSACGGEKEEVAVPDYVLNKEKLSDVIVDFTLAESASGINVLNLQGTKGDTVYAFNPLIDNNVKRKTFDTTMYFYSHNPKLFKEVYVLVLEKLSKMQASRK